jgi:hypothetical protein
LDEKTTGEVIRIILGKKLWLLFLVETEKNELLDKYRFGYLIDNIFSLIL